MLFINFSLALKLWELLKMQDESQMKAYVQAPRSWIGNLY